MSGIALVYGMVGIGLVRFGMRGRGTPAAPQAAAEDRDAAAPAEQVGSRPIEASAHPGAGFARLGV